MEVVFQRTGTRRYRVEARRADGSIVRMDPAPGYDDYFPHDLQHLIVEEQLGITMGIYGRLANGGTASTFYPDRKTGPQDKRGAARARRKLAKRNTQLAKNEPSGFARSERATLVAWHDWLTHCPESSLQQRAQEIAADVTSLLQRMEQAERAELVAALPTLRARIDDVARRWHGLAAGEHLTIRWSAGDRRSRGLT